MTASRDPLVALACAARGLAELAEALAVWRPPREEPEFVSEHEAARIAGISVGTLRQARRTGQLTFYGRKRSMTVKRSDLLAWIETRRAPIVRDVIDPEDSDMQDRMDRLASGPRKRRRSGK